MDIKTEKMEKSLTQVVDSAQSMEESSEYEAPDATEAEAEAVIRVSEFQLMFAILSELLVAYDTEAEDIIRSLSSQSVILRCAEDVSQIQK